MYTSTIPFSERGGVLRGCLDLLSGRFPGFVFGGSLGRLLPVFHFHEVTREELEPKFRHLADNGYRTVASDDIAMYARGRRTLPDRAVALCFDDAWASLVTVVAPLLAEYGLTAIAYAIPARMADEAQAGSPFVTWGQLTALHASGTVDVQSHTFSHSMIFHGAEPVGFVRPEYSATPLLNRPQIVAGPEYRFVLASELGAPLYPARSRMSDARRVAVPAAAHDRCVQLVASEGGARFFSRADWESRLRAAANDEAPAPVESELEQTRAIEHELAASRDTLNARLRTRTVNHICLPWGVAGTVAARALARTGYVSAFANRLRGVHAVLPGDDPYWLKRLPNRYIFQLPGRGRRYWFAPSPRTTAAL